MLNARQERFCIEYAKTANASDAYRKAGYKAKTERAVVASASRLLGNVDIKNRLAELNEEVRRESIASVAEVQERITAILRGEVQEEQIVVEGCGDGVSEAVTKTRSPKLSDRLKAAELLAKMQGAFDSSVRVNLVVPVIGGENELPD